MQGGNVCDCGQLNSVPCAQALASSMPQMPCPGRLAPRTHPTLPNPCWPRTVFWPGTSRESQFTVAASQGSTSRSPGAGVLRMALMVP